jgi:hypothetical protein
MRILSTTLHINHVLRHNFVGLMIVELEKTRTFPIFLSSSIISSFSFGLVECRPTRFDDPSFDCYGLWTVVDISHCNCTCCLRHIIP